MIFWYIVCLSIFFQDVFSIGFRDFDIYQNTLTCREVEEKIDRYLNKGCKPGSFYRLTPHALYVGDLENGQIDYTLYLSRNMVRTSKSGGVKKYHGLKGVRIAIDPGHFGGEFSELEDRCIKIPPLKTKTGKGLYFCEGDLTYLTAIELKRLLEDEGAIVFITRTGIGKGVIDEGFFAWKERHPELKGENISKIFRKYYNAEDLKKRAEKINAFSPDITLIIHYNAHLSIEERQKGVLLTQSNYNLAFIPGAFSCGELKKKENRYEFMRLLLSNTIVESLKLSKYIVREFVSELNVPLITNYYTTSYKKKYCLMQQPGVYCRNLALTRLVHSPLCYGETLIQNNKEEVYKLASEDSSIMGVSCSHRIKEVAQAYYKGVKQYFSHQE